MKADNRYVSYLDGFRGYSILLVLLGHFAISPIAVSQFGVTVFFFVSGFLITKLLIHEYGRAGRINLGDFYLRRVFRLYPALILMLLIVIGILLLYRFRINWTDILAGLFYFTNYFLVSHGPAPDPRYLLVSNILWSLSVEEHFYLVFPLAFAWFYRKPRMFTMALAAALLFFLGIRIIQYYAHPDSAFICNYYLTHARGDSIIYGCVAALLMYRFNASWYLAAVQSRVVLLLAIGLMMASFAIRGAFFQSTFVFSLQATGFFFLIPGFAFIPETHWTARLFNNAPIVYVGKLCYSLYLFHWVSLKLVNLSHPVKDSGWYLQVIPLTFGLALFSYFLVERPFLKLRRRFGSNARR